MNFIDTHFNNRFYLLVGQYNEQEIKNTISPQGKEKKGLGIREYGKISGYLLSLIGYSFKTSDLSGKTAYLNCKSYFNFISRIKIYNQNPDSFDPDFIQEEYEKGVNQQEVKKIKEVFNLVVKEKNKNLIELSQEILNQISPRLPQSNPLQQLVKPLSSSVIENKIQESPSKEELSSKEDFSEDDEEEEAIFEDATDENFDILIKLARQAESQTSIEPQNEPLPVVQENQKEPVEDSSLEKLSLPTWRELLPERQEDFSKHQILPFRSLQDILDILETDHPYYQEVLLPFLKFLSSLSPQGEKDYQYWMSLIHLIKENWKNVKDKETTEWRAESYLQFVDTSLRENTQVVFSNSSHLFEAFTNIRQAIYQFQRMQFQVNEIPSLLARLKEVDFNTFVKIGNDDQILFDPKLIDENSRLDSLSKKIISPILQAIFYNINELKTNQHYRREQIKLYSEQLEKLRESPPLDISELNQMQSMMGKFMKVLKVALLAYEKTKTMAYQASRIKSFWASPQTLVQNELEYLITNIGIYSVKLALNKSSHFLEFLPILLNASQKQVDQLEKTVRLIDHLAFNDTEAKAFDKKFLELEIESLHSGLEKAETFYNSLQKQSYYSTLVLPLLNKIFDLVHSCDISQDICEINNFDWLKNQFLTLLLSRKNT